MTDFWSHGLLASTLLVVLTVGGLRPAAAQDAAPQGSSETGSVTGVVVEAGNGASLPGANVKINGTTTGTSTDLNGRYRLEGLEPGTYALVFSFVGFQKKTVTGVEVAAGEATQLDVTLREEAAELKEVVIEAQAARDTEAGLMKKREAAPVVSNAISADLMSKAGVSNAADAMKKVTGASVVEGKYVFIRGLGDRYTTTQLNGVPMPTASPNRNAVQFDLFSTNLLDNIVTKKTFTPDLPGNFAGGLININTESYPTDLTVKVSSSTSIGTQTHFTDDFLSTPGGKWDFLAVGDGTRALPDPIDPLAPNQIPTNFRTTVRSQFQENGGTSEAGTRLNRLSKSFNNNMAPVQRQAPLNQSYSLSIGNEINSAGNPLGVLLNLNYKYNSSHVEGFQGRYRGPRGDGSDSLGTELLVDQSKSTTTAKLSGLLSLNYRLVKNHELGATAMYTRHGESTAETRLGQWTEQFGSDPTVHFQDRNLYYTRRELYSTQLRGRHLFPGLGDTEIEWTTAYSDTRQEEPDNRLFGNLMRETVEDETVVDTSYVVDLTGFPPPTRFYTDLSEHSYSGKLDVSIPFGNRESEVKVGGAYVTDHRDFRERRFQFVPPSTPVYNGDPREYFSEDNMGIIDTSVVAEGTPFEKTVPEFGNTVKEITEPEDAYEGDRDIAAGYAMVDVSVTDRLRIIGGARLERTDIQITTEASDNVQEADTSGSAASIEKTDLLPSINVVYELGDAMNLRLAGTRTLARPTFRELAPYGRTENVLGELVRGRPELERTLITNLDLRWEWFPAPTELIAVSVFGKDFQGAIEEVLFPSTNGVQTWGNADARVYGAEFEFQAGLGRIADPLKHFTISTNLSLVHSSAEEPKVGFGRSGGQQDTTNQETRPMEGQSPHTFNLDLSYENPNTGTSAGLYFNTFGERLTALGVFSVPDTYEKPFHQLDFTFSQRFREHWTVDFSVENILGDTAQEVLPFRGNEFDYQRTPRGRSISLGLSYKL
jgi:TonB-dependent receptor